MLRWDRFEDLRPENQRSTNTAAIEARFVLWHKMGVYMAKVRTRSKFLSNPPVYKPGVYKNTLIWQWLQQARTSDGDVALALQVMKKRVDMPNQFPHTTYLQKYMRKCRLEERVVQRCYQHLWNMYAVYRDLILHGIGPEDEKPWSNDGVRSSADRPTAAKRFLSR